MRHLKRPALLGLLLLACLLLAGCRMDSTMEELFTLPRLPTEYTTLSRQLDQLLSEGYEYMAPHLRAEHPVPPDGGHRRRRAG